MSEAKVMVSERAVVSRIRRKLAREGTSLHRYRSSNPPDHNIGDWYMVDAHNHVCGPYISDIGELAADMGVLKPWEELAR